MEDFKEEATVTLLKSAAHFCFDHFRYFNMLVTAVDRVRFGEKMFLKSNLAPNDSKEVFRLPKNNNDSIIHHLAAKAFLNHKQFREALLHTNIGLRFAETSECKKVLYTTHANIYAELENRRASLGTIHESSHEQKVHFKQQLNTEPVRSPEQIPGPSSRIVALVHEPTTIGEPLPESQANSIPEAAPTAASTPEHAASPQQEGGASGEGLLQLVHSPEFGCHITTTQAINIGDIIGWDAMLYPMLTTQSSQTCCAHCLQENVYCFRPCRSCVRVQFCAHNDTCYEQGMASFHKYECPIIDLLHRNVVYQIIVRKIVQTFRSADDIEDFIKFTEDTNSSNPFYTFSIIYKKDLHNYITKVEYTLEKNSAQKQIEEKFGISLKVAHLFLALQQKTTLVTDIFVTPRHQHFLREFIHHYMQITEANLFSFETNSSVRFPGEEQMEMIRFYDMPPLLSMINHSCRPNVAVATYGRDKYMLYAVRPIVSGGQLFRDYVHGYSPNKRQHILHANHYYYCRCYRHETELAYQNEKSKLARIGEHEKIKAHFKSIYLDDTPTVLKKLNKICRFMTKYDHLYPCLELFLFRSAMQSCFNILLASQIEFDFSDTTLAVKKSKPVPPTQLETEALRRNLAASCIVVVVADKSKFLPITQKRRKQFYEKKKRF